MSWAYTNSSFLWALPLIGIPILIHLINRRKAISHRFAAIEFIFRSAEHRRKNINLKSILLLLVRCLTMALIILALAGLFRKDKSWIAAGVTQPKSAVLLLDASASMRWTSSSGVRNFEVARSKALKLLKGFNEQDEIAIVTFDENVIDKNSDLKIGKTQSKKILSGAKAGYLGTDISVAINAAVDLLKTATHDQKQIHLFTDLAASGWEKSSMPPLELWQTLGGIKVLIHDVQSKEQPPNIAIRHVEVSKDPSQRGVYSIRADIENMGSQSVNEIPVLLNVGDQEVMRSFQSMVAHERIQVNFSYRSKQELPSGSHKSRFLDGTVALEKDFFVEDDKQWFVLKPQPVVRVLVVDGDAQPDPLRSETYYLTKALLPIRGEDAPLIPVMKALQEFDVRELKDQDLVVLANVKTMTGGQINVLRNFVSEGGALWITLGDQVEVDYYNKVFGDLLPARLRDIRYEQHGLHLSSLSKESPIFYSFTDQELKYFSIPLFSRYFVLETKSMVNYDVLMRFLSGSPALVSKAYKKGRVALWTTTIDRHWNDFPIQTTFVPFVHSVGLHLAGGDHREKVDYAVLGENFLLHADPKVQKIIIQDPSGEKWQETPDVMSAGNRGVVFKDAAIPGVYRSQFMKGEHKTLWESVMIYNVPTEESDFQKITVQKVSEMFPKDSLNIINNKRSDVKMAGFFKEGSHSWIPFLFIGLTLLLILEGVLSFL